MLATTHFDKMQMRARAEKLERRNDRLCPQFYQRLSVAVLAGRAFAVVEIDLGGHILGAAMDASDLQLRPLIRAERRHPGHEVLAQGVLIANHDMIIRNQGRPLPLCNSEIV